MNTIPAHLKSVHDQPGTLFTVRWNQRSRWLGKPVHHEPEYAAKVKRGFSFYFAPIEIAGISSVSLITAFFDDPENPFHIWTPFFGDDEMTDDLLRLLAQETFDVHFFDENNRELLGYTASNKSASSLGSRLAGVHFLQRIQEILRECHDKAMLWFLARTKADDSAAIQIEFGEALVPEDLFIQDFTPKARDFHGSPGFTYTTLERDGEPGKYQERDIVETLQKTFAPGQIYMNPCKAADGREIVDVMIVGDANVILIQAKDSPNTEKSMQRSITRKIKVAENQVAEGASQLGGAISYVKLNRLLRLKGVDGDYEVNLGSRRILGLVVVRELFDTEYATYSPIILGIAMESGVPCLVLDFHELYSFAHHRPTEGAFVAAFMNSSNVAVANNKLPRNRFGFAPDEMD